MSHPAQTITHTLQLLLPTLLDDQLNQTVFLRSTLELMLFDAVLGYEPETYTYFVCPIRELDLGGFLWRDGDQCRTNASTYLITYQSLSQSTTISAAVELTPTLTLTSDCCIRQSR